MAIDDWGCGSSFGESKSLSELVDGLTTKKHPETTLETLPFPMAEVDNVQIQVVPCILKAKNAAPKILKKKSSINKVNKEPNLKRVTFEVGQLLARETVGAEKEEARERLVVSLGGLPTKKKAVNYKQYKEDLIRKKEDIKEKTLSFAPNRVIKKKSKK